MKTIGILGGMGPQTTSKVYLSIIDIIRKSGVETYPPIVIYNLPFPFSIEHEAIAQGINVDKMLPYLIAGAKVLEKSGADFGILPCNTLHIFIDDIRQSVSIPFLSILEETTVQLELLRSKKVAVFASMTTVKSDIYRKVLEDKGITIVYPEKDQQDSINTIITELVCGKKDASYGKTLGRISDSLAQQGVEAILLACTDLQLIIDDIHASIPVIDTTKILIDASVREMTC